MVAKSCCFIGHRNIEITDELVARLTSVIESLIREGVTRFIFGSRSDFDSLCHDVVTDLKIKYPDIVRVTYNTQSEASTYEYERKDLEEGLSKLFKKEIHIAGYEEIYKPDVMYRSGKASYIERNEIMIDNSDYCVFYFDKNYTPKVKLISRRSIGGLWTSSNSGTAIAYKYAKRKKKRIYNVFE